MERYLRLLFDGINDQLNQLENRMTTAESAQAKLDAAVSLLNEVFGNVETEIAALKANAPADLDFTALDAAVARGQAATDAVEGAPAEPPA